MVVHQMGILSHDTRKVQTRLHLSVRAQKPRDERDGRGAGNEDMLSSFRTFSRASTAGGMGMLSMDGSQASGPACEPGPQERAILRALYAANFSAAVNAALEVPRLDQPARPYRQLPDFCVWLLRCCAGASNAQDSAAEARR